MTSPQLFLYPRTTLPDFVSHEHPDLNSSRFIRLDARLTPHLVLGSDILHYELLRIFLDEQKLIYQTTKKEGDKPFPNLDGPEYRVLGMGFVHVDHPRKSIEFYGNSMSYGMRFVPSHLSPFINILNDNGYSVEFNKKE